MFNIENYEVVLVPAEIEDDEDGEGSAAQGKNSIANVKDDVAPSKGLQSEGESHPEALALLEHDIIITFDQNDWPATIPAGVLVPDPCLDASLKNATLLLSCPVKGGIEEVAFINVPEEVCDLLRQAGRLTFAGLNENGVVWEQTISLFV